MDRLSRAALWTLGAAAFAASGCANILGFQDFSDDAGAPIDPQTSSSTATHSDPGSSASGGTGSTAMQRTSGSTNVGTSSTQGGTPTTIPGSSSTSGSVASSTSNASSSSVASSSTSAGPAGPCTFGTANNGNGSFTYYYFGQGTYQQNGKYKTACGYNGTESGSGSGATDTVSNAANVSPAQNTYFAAIPGASSGDFNTVTSCGACVEITGQNGKKIVATVIDECPLSSNPLCTSGHLDLSTQAFDQLGYSVGNPSGTTWKFVACPVTGNIQAVNNSSGQVYLQNSVYPISTVNGQGPTNYGYFNVGAGKATVTSSAANQTITINIPGGGGDTGGNFTEPTGCY